MAFRQCFFETPEALDMGPTWTGPGLLKSNRAFCAFQLICV